MLYDQQRNQALPTKTSGVAHPKSADQQRQTQDPIWQQAIGNRAVMQRMRASNLEHTDTAAPSPRPQGGGNLTSPLKRGIERLSGVDLSDVSVHYNSDKPAQLQALAYAHGNQIHLGPGQEEHLPHEAWHIVQQRQGRVSTERELVPGLPLNADEKLEQEADRMGDKALRDVNIAPIKYATANQPDTPVVQRRLPNIDAAFIRDHHPMALELILHSIANLSAEDKANLLKASTRVDEDALIEEIKASDAKTLLGWYAFIRAHIPADNHFVSTIDQPDLASPDTEQIKRIKNSIAIIIEQLGKFYNNEAFLKQIFGPDADIAYISGVYLDIWKRLHKHHSESTSPVMQNNDRSHNEWVGVAGMASFEANYAQFTPDQLEKLLNGTPDGLATLVHEYCHIADDNIIDHAYSLSDMQRLTTKQRMHNAESYAQAFLEQHSGSDPRRHYDAALVVESVATDTAEPANVVLKRRMKQVKANLTHMWATMDDAYLTIKKLKNGLHAGEPEKINFIKINLIDAATHPFKLSMRTHHEQLQALLEDRSKSMNRVSSKLVSILKLHGLTKEDVSATDVDDSYIVPLITALAIQSALNLSDENATLLVEKLNKLKA